MKSIESELINIVKGTIKRDQGTQPYDTTATVTRVENGTAWVHIDGGVSETPVRLTVDAHEGDTVQLRVSGGSAWIVGNETAPPTDDSTANYAVNIANDVRKNIVEVENFVVQEFEAEKAVIGELEADNATIKGNLTAATARIGDLEADTAKIHDLTADQLTATVGYIDDLTSNHVTAQDITADHATVGSLDSNYAHITNGVIDNAKIGYADVNQLDAHYANIDLANVNTAQIDNGIINTAAIVDENVFTVTGNKATIKEINADNITVRNLNAKNLKIETADGYVTIGDKKTPTKEFIDSLVDDMQDKIDAAIETFTSTSVPLLNNYPASNWKTDDERLTHVGDICFVTNSALAEDGYSYRFAYDNTTKTFNWVLIKDNDVTKALQDISDLETFQSETTSWIEETDEGIKTIRQNYTSLSGTVDKTVKASVQLWFTKANTTAPDAPKSQVTTNNANTANAWNLAVPNYNATYPNYFYCWQYQYADNSYGWSAVIRDVAMGESQSQARKGVSDAATAQSTANANVKNTVMLWFSKANTTAPTAPTSEVTSTSTGGNAWTTVVPTWNSTYPNYFYCYQFELGNSTFKWGDVVYDRATSESQQKAAAALPASDFTSFKSTTFKELVDEVDEQSSTITKIDEKVDKKADSSTVTTLSNTVNSVKQTADTNKSNITTLTKTVSDNKTDIEKKYSDLTQDVDTFKTTVGKTYQTKDDMKNYSTTTQMNSAIEQKAGEISLSVAKTQAYNASQPNLSPFFESIPYRTDSSYKGVYWQTTADQTATTARMVGTTPLTEGWAHIETTGTLYEIAIPRIESFAGGDKATLLIEWKNVEITGSNANLYARKYSNNCQFNQNSYSCNWTSSTPTSGSKYISMTCNTTATGTGSWNAAIIMAFYNASSVTFKGDLRISIYAGDYTGAWKSYSGEWLYATQSEFKVTTDGISSEVSKKVGASEIISKINQSPESITINANRVNIEGAAIFSSGRLSQTSLNNAYDAKGAATTAVDSANQKSLSRGEQLVTNGSGLLGNNTNFNSWTFDGSNSNDTPGSFTRTASGTILTDEFFPVDTSKKYRFDFDAKSKDNTMTVYSMLSFYDVDKHNINALYVAYFANTLTTLTQDLKPGDTVVHLNDLTNWNVATDTRTYQRGFIFWNYKNSFGYQYPALTYSRNVRTNLYTDANVNKTAKTITLTSAWPSSYGTIPKGTQLSQSNSGSNYSYAPLVGVKVPTSWTSYSAVYDGVSYTGTLQLSKFWPGTAYCKVGFLWNYNNSSTDQLWITNVKVYEDYQTAIEAAQSTANAAKTTADAAAPKTSAVSEEQYIYISKASGTTSVSANTTWVTVATDSQNTWTTKRPTYNSSYPVLFVAKQKKVVSGTVTCTTPVKDDTTTVIDGGHITTGTIDASKATITNINASNITTGTLSADRIGTGSIVIGKLASAVQTNISNGQAARTQQAVKDTRNDNQNPAWYITNYGSEGEVREFKIASKIGCGTSTAFGQLTTHIPWENKSGGYPKQTFEFDGKQYWRHGTSDTAWSAWVDAYGTAVNSAKTATNYITNIDSNKGITVKPQDSSGNDYLQMNSTDIRFVRNNTDVMNLTDSAFRIGTAAGKHATVDTNGLHVWTGAESTASNEVALFGTTARIGTASGKHTTTDTNGFHVWTGAESTASNEVAVLDGTTLRVGAPTKQRVDINTGGLQLYSSANSVIANLGYASGKNISGGTSVTPYFTYGTRATNSVIGNYSISEGISNTASGAHSHASGYYVTASGGCSFAHGYYTIASGDYQFVAGRYNVEDSSGDNLFIIGNGENASTRRNAFSVSKSGYVQTYKDELLDNTNSTRKFVNSGSNATITSAKYIRRGNIAQIYISWTVNAALSVPASGNISNIEVGILLEDYRPVILTAAFSNGDNAGAAWYNIDTNGVIKLGACEGTGSARTIAKNTAFNLYATYIVE